MQTVLAREIGLFAENFWNTQVIESGFGWKLRLIVAVKQRFCPRNVGPLGEASSPGRIVFWYRMKLRQIERNNSYRRHWRRLTTLLHYAFPLVRLPTRRGDREGRQPV